MVFAIIKGCIIFILLILIGIEVVIHKGRFDIINSCVSIGCEFVEFGLMLTIIVEASMERYYYDIKSETVTKYKNIGKNNCFQ